MAFGDRRSRSDLLPPNRIRAALVRELRDAGADHQIVDPDER
jgi:hypothetical protein